jgi:exonuclease I
VAANKQPILLPIDFVRDGRSGINIKDDLILRRANIVANEDGFRRRACRALAKRFEKEGEPAQYVEERIYDKFASLRDSQLLRKFHLIPWEARISILNQLDDARFVELGYRIIHIERPQILPENIRSQLDAWRQERLNGPMGARFRTLADAIREADNLVGTSDAEPQALVSDVRAWLAKWRDSTTDVGQFKAA